MQITTKGNGNLGRVIRGFELNGLYCTFGFPYSNVCIPSNKTI